MSFKLLSVKKSDKPKKKYVATFENLKTKKKKKTYFGAEGMEDYLIHKDKKRRELYRKRHQKDLKTNDPTRAGFLSYYILWGDTTSLKENIKIYKNKFNL